MISKEFPPAVTRLHPGSYPSRAEYLNAGEEAVQLVERGENEIFPPDWLVAAGLLTLHGTFAALPNEYDASLELLLENIDAPGQLPPSEIQKTAYRGIINAELSSLHLACAQNRLPPAETARKIAARATSYRARCDRP